MKEIMRTRKCLLNMVLNGGFKQPAQGPMSKVKLSKASKVQRTHLCKVVHTILGLKLQSRLNHLQIKKSQSRVQVSNRQSRECVPVLT